MPVNSWPHDNPYEELSPSVATLEDDGLEESLAPYSDGRRRKAAVMLVLVWGSTWVLHSVTWGSWVVWGLAAMAGIQGIKLFLARSEVLNTTDSATDANGDWPFISLLVPAKNEEAVIGHLVKALLCNLDYPANRYELWVIDDNSTDNTARELEKLQKHYPQLRVFQRGAGATGGKSGALNQVWPKARGEILAVFDADAQVQPDTLKKVVPLFATQKTGAVQLRKAIANASENFWTRGQRAEMALDSFFQTQRMASNGIVELRGNGQFLRRKALERCGGFNEETITDDLDLSFRLHLGQWDIAFLPVPAVNEEGVVRAKALWHQRNRWAEGGYQRFLDYWPQLFSGRVDGQKLGDLWGIWLIQYFLPTAAIPDAAIALSQRQVPIWSPLTGVALTLTFLSMAMGLRRTRTPEQPISVFTVLNQSLFGVIYMFHWFLVMGSTTARMAVRPKRLKWVKTTHQGAVH